MTIGRIAAVAVLAGASALVAGCATVPRAAPATAASPGASEDVLSTRHPAMVIGDGSSTTLCTGAVLQSLPPQCAGGIRLVGWDWERWDGDVEQAGAVRWGEFTVTGVWAEDVDGTAQLTVTDAVPAPQDAEAPVESTVPDLRTPCREPDGGWPFHPDPDDVLDEENRTGAVAAVLAGYATLWWDDSWVGEPAAGSTPAEQLDHYARNAGRMVLNVGVHEDVAGAEERLSEVWHGALCVYEADFVAAQKEAIVQEILADHPAASVGMDTVTGAISVTVPYDRDGRLQRRLDARYGDGAVQVTSWFERRR